MISSVSCLYGIGNPEDFHSQTVTVRRGEQRDMTRFLYQLVDALYSRTETDFKRGTFRVRGDVLEIFPAASDKIAVRVEFFGDEIDRILEIDTLTGEIKSELKHTAIFPASHYVVPKEKLLIAAENIRAELKEQVDYFKSEDKLLDAE